MANGWRTWCDTQRGGDAHRWAVHLARAHVAYNLALGAHGEPVVDVCGCMKGLVPHGTQQMAVGEKGLYHDHDG